MSVLKAKLGKVKASQLAFHAGLEDERRAELTTCLDVNEMRIHDVERAHSGNAQILRIPCPRNCEPSVMASTTLARHSAAIVKMPNAIADANKQVRRGQIDRSLARS